MERVHREIARDVARLTGGVLTQVVSLGAEGSRTAGLELALPAEAGREAVAALLEREPGAGPARALLAAGARFRVVVRCEPALEPLLPAPPRGAGPWSVFHLLAGEPDPVVLRVAVPSRPGAATLRVLDAAARLAAGRLEAARTRLDVSRERRALAELRTARDTLAGLHGAGTQLMGETDEDGVFRVIARELHRLGHHAGVLAPAPEGGNRLAWRFTSLAPPVQRAMERVIGQPLGAVRVDLAAAPLVRRCLAIARPVESSQIRPVVRQLFATAGLRELRLLGRLLGFRRAILAPLGRAGGAPVGVLVVAAPRHRRGDLEAIDAFAQQASIALEKARLFAALERGRSGLEREVERRTRELTLAVSALEEAGRRRDHFLANVSHELRTPLVTVLGWSDLLLQEKLGPLAPRQRAALEVIGTSGRRLRGFIDELLELERHELTRGGLTFAALDVGDVLTQALVALAPRYAERGLRLRARVARGTPKLWGDRERILQALSNLLVNAERYSPDGALVRVAAARVRPGRLEIAVADRGAGIPDEHLPHVFERLYQVRDDRGAGHRGGALGIGLALVKSIVEAHGGAVSVRSKVGHGTTFRLSLPTVEVLEGEGVTRASTTA